MAQPSSEYWNPRMETLPREQLNQLQLAKLKTLVRWASERSPFYRVKFAAAGVSAADLKSLDDIRRIPLLTKSEMLESQAALPPFGDIMTASPELGINYHQTSGTSGKAPLRVVDTARDWSWGADIWSAGFYAFGIRKTDIAFVAFTYGAFIGFWGAHYGLERIGATVVPGGGGTSEARIKQILDIGATVVVATPTYALRLAEAARDMGVDLAKESKVRLTCHAGEPGANIPGTKRAIEEAWGSKCGDFAGMTEIGSNQYFECRFQPGGVHLHEDHFIHEVVDPDTLEPVPYGGRGELLLTSFGRGSLPLIRMRTGDLVERIPASECPCGRTFDILKGGIIGRADDMKLIRGVNVYPSAVESIVREYTDIDEFQIVLSRKSFVDEITVNVEPRPGFPTDAQTPLIARLGAHLADAHEGLRFNVVVVERDSLPRFELKSKRLVDQRA